MMPFDVTLSSVVRSELLIFISVIFWIYVPISFILVTNYASKQFRSGTLIDGKTSPLPFTISSTVGAFFILSVMTFIFLQSALYIIVVVAGISGLLMENGQSAVSQFGLIRLNPTRALSWSLLIFGAVMLVETPLATASMWLLNLLHVPHPEQETVETFRQFDEPSKIFWFVVQAVFILPFIEELFFRGFLLTFLKKYTSTWMALVLSSGIFAFAHVNLGAAIPLWFLGLVLGVAYEHTGSLLVPIGIHACWNLVTAISILLDKGNS